MHVNCLDIRAAVASIVAGVPYIGHLRVIFPLSMRDRWFVKHSRLTITVSDAVQRTFCQTHSGCENKFVKVPNPVKVPRAVRPANLRSIYGFPPDSIIAGTVGRMDPLKGFEYFIEAAKLVRQQLPSARFIIVGGIITDEPAQQDYRSFLQKKIEDAGLSNDCVMTGFRRDVMDVIAGFDILVVSSVTIKVRQGQLGEGFGRVAVEGMALGVPVIVSDTGGLPEIVEDGVSGTIVAAGNVAALAQAMIDLMQNRLRRQSFAIEGKKRFKALYTVEQHCERLESLYAGVLGLKKLARACCVCSGRLFKIKECCRDGFNVLECSRCSYTFVYPVPSDSHLADNYSEDYYTPWLKNRAARLRMWDSRLRIVQRTAHKGMLLDVGCGDGLFLERARAAGWDVKGAEISAFAASHIREKLGIEVFLGCLDKCPFPAKTFDCITMWHSLEHTTDPAKMIRSAFHLLKDDGTLVIAVPNLDNIVYRFFYRIVKHRPLHLFDPADRELHLCHFNCKSLKILLESIGFNVINILPDTGIIDPKSKMVDIIATVISVITGKILTEAIMVIGRKRP